MVNGESRGGEILTGRRLAVYPKLITLSLASERAYPWYSSVSGFQSFHANQKDR